MMSAIAALKTHLKTVHDIQMAMNLLNWDRQVCMPRGSAGARAGQLATLSRLAHDRFTGDQTARLLDEAEAEAAALPADSDDASYVRVVRADYAEATRLPGDHVAELQHTIGIAHEYWVDARKNNDFAHFQPILEKLVDLKRRECDLIGYSDHPYTALLNQYERGATTTQVAAIFAAHRAEIVPLIAAIRERADAVSDEPVRRHFPIEVQKRLTEQIVAAIGYDFEHGRQDVAVHPFCNANSKYDVRITTRFDEHFFNPAFFGSLHEAGHALYEQGVADELEGNLLGGGTSLGVHESQSRLWENLVGRSRAFWRWAYPQVQAAYPALADVSEDDFYRAVNRVQPSFIRVEADEATYNLHIMMRFDLECALIKGEIQVADLPREWNERFEAYLGIVPPTDTLGVLQDVHWSMGLFGYFATYALGNFLAAQYYRQALTAHPSIPDEIAAGHFTTLLGWMRRSIHVHGRKFTSDELTRRLTGESVQSVYYTQYLKDKYGALYDLAG
jgi:carboxypeptidase Taq